MRQVTTADPADLSLSAAAEALRDGTLGTVEYTSALLGRIDATEPTYHAYAYYDRETALAAAQALQDTSPGPHRLHGVPLGVKDLIDVRGMPCTGGCPGLVRREARTDATVVATLRGHGALFLGKHTTHELGLGLDDPGTRHAWDPQRYPGGSSAGGAVSVALGSAPAALGTDAGGSVRKPAALNGIVGFKPTHGQLPMTGVLPSARTLDHVGLLTRTVADCALLWEGLSGPVHDETPDLRIGWVELPLEILHPDVARAAERFRATLVQAGVDVVALHIPGLLAAQEAHAVIASAEMSRAYPPNGRIEHAPAVLQALRDGQRLTAAEVAKANVTRARLIADVADAMTSAGCQLLCLPTVPIPPVAMKDYDAATHLPTYTRLTHPFNLTGQPAISIPVDRGASAFPVGMQLVGGRSADALVLATSLGLEARGIVHIEPPTHGRRSTPVSTGSN